MSLQLSDTKDQKALARTLAEISRLGLDQNLMELEIQGFTILRDVLSGDQVERAKKSILNRIEALTGKRPDVNTATAEDFEGKQYVYYMLYDDVVFEEILMQERPLALATYLLGESCKLSSIGCHFKGQGDGGTIDLHADGANGITPLPATSIVCNVNYALVPYSREAGATALVPGTHKLCRQPTPEENKLTGESANPLAIPADMNPGDCVIWHGNTWHGAFNRKAPGLRLSVTVYFVRDFIRPLEDYIDNVPQEWLDKYGPRFAMRLQQGSVPGAKTQAKRVADSERADKFKAAYEKSIGVGIGERTNPHH